MKVWIWLRYEYKVFYSKQIVFLFVLLMTPKSLMEMFKCEEFFLAKKEWLKKGISGMRVFLA